MWQDANEIGVSSENFLLAIACCSIDTNLIVDMIIFFMITSYMKLCGSCFFFFARN